MTAKQFVEIIKYFAESICGDKMLIQDNNVDDVKRFVDFMEYPHQMNKSWFKVPTVSIAYDRNVEFLDWLCDFLPTASNDDSVSGGDGIEYKITEANNLGDQEYVNNFHADLRNGFVIWSDRTTEFDEWKAKWSQEMITTKTGLADIDASIERLETELGNLQTNDSPFGSEQLLHAQQKKRDELTAEVKKMAAAVEEKRIDFQETSNEINQLTLKREQLTFQVSEMKKTIKSQTISADDRQNIIADKTHKSHLATEKRTYLNNLKSINDDYQVKIARMKKQKTNKIFALNAFVQKIFQIGVSFDEVTIDQVSFHENCNKDEIKVKMQLINRIKEIVFKRRIDMQTSLTEIHSKVTSLSDELSAIEDEISGHKKHLQSLEIHTQKIENEIADAKYDSQQQQLQWQVKMDNVQALDQDFQMKIKISENLAKSLKEENKKIFHGIELKSRALLDAKRERQARQEALLSELEQLTDQLKDSVNRLK